jgi:hypothetical protein
MTEQENTQVAFKDNSVQYIVTDKMSDVHLVVYMVKTEIVRSLLNEDNLALINGLSRWLRTWKEWNEKVENKALCKILKMGFRMRRYL